jgi:hypothetical protein
MINIPQTRLINQQLLRPRFTSPQAVVRWMGAIQAQDYPASLRAVCLRLPGVSYEQAEAAFNRGEFLRTHVLRPTWHLAAAEDIRWLLELTAPQVKAKTRSRDLEFGLTEDIFAESNAVFTRALRGGRHLLREELARTLEEAGIDTGGYRLAHLLMRAELDAVICSGAPRGKKHTYALLSERAPGAGSFDRETSLAMLAARYFTSRGPATLKDFVWWSGLTMTAARQAILMADKELSIVELDGQTYYFHPGAQEMKTKSGTVHYLPAFDEYLIAYADRSAVLAAEQLSKAIASNGIFRPVILHDGIVAGTWKNAGPKMEENYF